MNPASTPLSRRRLLGALGTIGAGLAVGGCAAPAATPAAPDTTDFAYGDITTTVPTSPQRVVVVEGRGDLEFALLAGYPVIATGKGSAANGQLPGDQYAGLLDPSTVVLESVDSVPDHEQLAALAPDLIVIRANGWRMDWYDNAVLTRIAPVLPVEVNAPDFRDDMDGQLRLLGRGTESERLLAEYDAKLAAARDELAATVGGATVAMLTTQMVASGSIRQWTHQLGTSVVTDLGLTVLGLDPADEDGETVLSLEEIGTVAGADLVFHQNTDPSTMTPVPTWQALPAVRAGDAFSYPRSYNNGLVRTASAVVDLVLESARGASIRT